MTFFMIAPVINSESLLALRFLLFAGGWRSSLAKSERRKARGDPRLQLLCVQFDCGAWP